MSKFYSYLITNIAFPIIDLIGGTSFYRSYELLKNFEYADRQEITKYQTNKLRKILTFAYKHVPYYHSLFNKIKITEFSNFEINDLHKIPPLTKDIIRNNFDELKSSGFSKIKHKYHSTGGSTGNPIYFYQDFDSYSLSWPANIRGWGFIGFTLGDRIMTLGSSSLFKKKKSKEQQLLHALFRVRTYGGINMSEEICEQYIIDIKKYNIKYIYGYATSIFILARHVLKTGNKINIKGVMPTSEICPPHYKECYKRAFNCQICDSYGARDGNISAFECPEGNFHLSEFSIPIIEGEGKSGNVLVTDLYNKSMPMINYEVGDALVMSDEICKCGRQQLISTEILGRVQNLITFDNGRVITGPGWTILFKDRNVNKYRIRQTGGMNLEVDIVPAKNYHKKIEESIILDSFKRNVGEDVDIKFNYFGDLETLPSGKAAYFMTDRLL